MINENTSDSNVLLVPIQENKTYKTKKYIIKLKKSTLCKT